jgi:hypothetical protein
MTRIEERDERGHFTKVSLTSEEAREMNRRSRLNRDGGKAKLRMRADKLLLSLGVEGGYEAAPEELRMLAEKYITKGAPSTMSLLLKQTGKMVKPPTVQEASAPDWDPESGDPCPLCGGVRVTIALDNESAQLIAGILNAQNVEAGSPVPVAGRENGGGRGS